MTRDDADHAASQLVASWPGHAGVTADVWAADIIDLDFRVAMEAIVRLRREQDRPPTIAALRAACRAIAGADQATPTRPDYSDAISFDDYRARLESRAGHNPAAADELDRWARIREGRVTTALRLDLDTPES